MQLESKKYYKMRNRPDIYWVYITNINEMVVDWQASCIYLQGIGDTEELRHGLWRINGNYQLGESAESPMDLVRELDRPPPFTEIVHE
jgi:hypothetical protein